MTDKVYAGIGSRETPLDICKLMTTTARIVGTWGPLPYDMEECQSRLREVQVELAGQIAAHAGTEAAEHAKTWRFECKQQEGRPPLAKE
jgi:hypothetical protein